MEVTLNRAYFQIYSQAEPNAGQFCEQAYQQAYTLLTKVKLSFSAKIFYQDHNLWLRQIGNERGDKIYIDPYFNRLKF